MLCSLAREIEWFTLGRADQKNQLFIITVINVFREIQSHQVTYQLEYNTVDDENSDVIEFPIYDLIAKDWKIENSFFLSFFLFCSSTWVFLLYLLIAFFVVHVFYWLSPSLFDRKKVVWHWGGNSVLICGQNFMFYRIFSKKKKFRFLWLCRSEQEVLPK